MKMQIRKKKKLSGRVKYTGNHLPIKDKEGICEWNNAHNRYLFRPDSTGKSEWYRVFTENLTELE